MFFCLCNIEEVRIFVCSSAEAISFLWSCLLPFVCCKNQQWFFQIWIPWVQFAWWIPRSPGLGGKSLQIQVIFFFFSLLFFWWCIASRIKFILGFIQSPLICLLFGLSRTLNCARNFSFPVCNYLLDLHSCCFPIEDPINPCPYPAAILVCKAWSVFNP